jgi:hypothetical protein
VRTRPPRIPSGPPLPLHIKPSRVRSRTVAWTGSGDRSELTGREGEEGEEGAPGAEERGGAHVEGGRGSRGVRRRPRGEVGEEDDGCERGHGEERVGEGCERPLLPLDHHPHRRGWSPRDLLEQSSWRRGVAGAAKMGSGIDGNEEEVWWGPRRVNVGPTWTEMSGSLVNGPYKLGLSSNSSVRGEPSDNLFNKKNKLHALTKPRSKEGKSKQHEEKVKHACMSAHVYGGSGAAVWFLYR